MADIQRFDFDTRINHGVIHNGTLYLTGQVARPGQSAADQMHEVLGKIDALLAKAGTDKTRLLQAIIWLKSMDDFAEMNAVWDAWVPEGHAPARACGSADLATPDYRVEITVIAALP